MILIALLINLVIITFGENPVLLASTRYLGNLNNLSPQSSVAYKPSAVQTVPILKPGATPYLAQAKSALIYDVGSGQILYSKNTNASLPMASLTKLMTALVIMQEHSNDEIVTIPNNLPTLTAADQKVGVTPGEQFRLSELMKALLINSGNDVANSLAIWDSGSIESFSEKMNHYALSWGLNESNFVNPTGLDAINHHSSSQDLLELSTILLHNQEFRQIINTQKTTIVNTMNKSYVINTTNEDLKIPYVYGIKTGLTDAAGQSLILLAEKNNKEVITVVLNSPNRFQESKNMVDYTFNNYIWK